MNLMEERRRLIEAARSLHECGLVARTWGNLSLRVDGDRFLLTPSGRTYETMQAEDLALVSLEDGQWEGPLKPSSEKGLHARIYRCRPEIGAVIHTHQPAASSLAAARQGFLPTSEADRQRLGESVPCVRYALPTTKRLAKLAAKVAATTPCRAMLLSNHGAVCLGSTIEDALQVAIDLERIAEKEILGRFRAGAAREELLEHYAPASTAAEMDPATERELLRAMKADRPEKTFILHKGDFARAAARTRRTVYPLVDDLAQLIGTTLPVVSVTSPSDLKGVKKALRRRSALLIPGLGCLCMGDDASEAEATAMVAEKGCRVEIESSYLGGGHRIRWLETLLMRFIFLAKYSKKASG